MKAPKYFIAISLLCLLSCTDNSKSIPESFQIQDGFDLTLVASEPLIMDPVDLEFNAKGEALVLEMLFDQLSQLLDGHGSDVMTVDRDRLGIGEELWIILFIVEYRVDLADTIKTKSLDKFFPGKYLLVSSRVPA